MKDKNHMLSMDAEKHLTKFNTPSIQYSFMTKPLNMLNTKNTTSP